MSFIKNKFVLVIIFTILIGGATGLYLSQMNTTKISDNSVAVSGSGADAEKVGEVMKKLNDLTNE